MNSTIYWKEFTGLLKVLIPKKSHELKNEGSTSERIIEQVKKCPGGALSDHYNKMKENIEKFKSVSLHLT